MTKLTVKGVTSLAQPGRYADGGGLYLQVRKGGSKSWVFRYMRQGKAHEMGLGPAPIRDQKKKSDRVSLADARDRALQCRILLRDGKEPLEDRKKTAVAEALRVTFREAVEAYLKDHGPGFKNEKQGVNFRGTMAAYAYPAFGDKPVADLTFKDVLDAIKPIWQTKTETASRVRGRTEQVLGYATVNGWRTGDNPARWQGNLEHLLPAPRAVSPVEHRAAMPYKEVSVFMALLQQKRGMDALALQFTILTACRTMEVLGADWSEVSLSDRVWMIRKERMKTKKEHRVPLSEPALAILRSRFTGEKQPETGLVFPTRVNGGPMSINAMSTLLKRMKQPITVHGFRSSFRDWAAEVGTHPAEVAEMALAHAVGSKVEAAYRRGDLFQKRIAIMDDWAKFVT